MEQRGAYGEVIAKSFGIERAPTLIARRRAKTEIAVTEIRDDRAKPGRNAPIPPEDPFLICILLRDFPRPRAVWEDGRPVFGSDSVTGQTLVHDLKRNPVIDFDRHHSIHFYLPRRALEVVADDAHAPRIGDLRYEPGIGVDDAPLRLLAASLMPAASA